MNRVSRKFLLRATLLPALVVCVAGCPGSQSIVPFDGTVPAAIKNLDGTYKVTVNESDTSVLGDNLTLVIAGGLFTKFGLRDLTPTNVTGDGNHVDWTSGASITSSFSPTPIN